MNTYKYFYLNVDLSFFTYRVYLHLPAHDKPQQCIKYRELYLVGKLDQKNIYYNFLTKSKDFVFKKVFNGKVK